MKELALRQRLKLYVRFVTLFIIGVFGLLFLVWVVAHQIIGAIGVMLLPFLSHGYLGFNLMRGSNRKKLFISILMSSLSGALMVYAIWVDESTRSHVSMFSLFLDGEFNYIIYFVWTTIVLWEVAYRIAAKRSTSPEIIG